MYELKPNGQITLPRGDTLLFKVTIAGREFPEGTMAVFGICGSSRSNTVLRKQFPVEDNTIVVRLSNADTRVLPAGKYRWDIRLVTDPEFDEEGTVRCDDPSDDVISIFSGAGMPLFEVTEVAAYV